MQRELERRPLISISRKKSVHTINSMHLLHLRVVAPMIDTLACTYYTYNWCRLSKEVCLSESLQNKVASMSRTILRLVERHKELQTEVRRL